MFADFVVGVLGIYRHHDGAIGAERQSKGVARSMRQTIEHVFEGFRGPVGYVRLVS